MDDITSNFTTTTMTPDIPMGAYWLYGLAGVMCLVSIMIGCGFACTQFCKACLFSYPPCQRGARSLKTNPIVRWLRMTHECLLGGRCSVDEDIEDNVVHPEVPAEGVDATTRTEVERSIELYSAPPPYLEALTMPRPAQPIPTAVDTDCETSPV